MASIVVASQPWGWSHRVESRFAPLVARLEARAEADAAGYRRRVLAAALLGYAFLAVILALLLGGIALLVGQMVVTKVSGGAVRLVLLLSIPTWLLLRSLWFRLEPPQGLPITAAEAPALFEAIEAVRSACAGPPLYQVLITADFNAAIVQHPRFGLFGGYRNYLLVGLPLMQALEVAAFSAVVGHEFGHLVNSDGKIGSFVYRVRATWARLSERLGDGGTGAVLRRFFAWYGPWFNAYSFVLARQAEYAADRVAAQVTSADVAAQALTTVAVEAQRYDSQHWDAVFAQIGAGPQPPAMPFASARGFFADTGADRRALLRLALAQATGLDDTHPALAQRLASLGHSAAPPPPCRQAAADVLLPDGGAGIAADFDLQWWANIADAWAADHAAHQASAARLAVLEESKADWRGQDKWDHAWLTERHRGGAAAEPLYQALIESPGEPDDVPAARFALARLQLAEGRREGLDAMEALVADDAAASFVAEAARLALLSLASQPTEDAAATARWRARSAAEAARSAALDAELVRLDHRAEFIDEPPPLALAEAVATVAAGDKRVKRVRIGRRRLVNGPPGEQIVIGFQTRWHFLEQDYAALLDDLLAAAAPHGQALAIQTNGGRRWLRRRLAKLAGNLVYRR